MFRQSVGGVDFTVQTVSRLITSLRLQLSCETKASLENDSTAVALLCKHEFEFGTGDSLKPEGNS